MKCWFVLTEYSLDAMAVWMWRECELCCFSLAEYLSGIFIATKSVSAVNTNIYKLYANLMTWNARNNTLHIWIYRSLLRTLIIETKCDALLSEGKWHQRKTYIFSDNSIIAEFDRNERESQFTRGSSWIEPVLSCCQKWISVTAKWRTFATEWKYISYSKVNIECPTHTHTHALLFVDMIEFSRLFTIFNSNRWYRWFNQSLFIGTNFNIDRYKISLSL